MAPAVITSIISREDEPKKRASFIKDYMVEVTDFDGEVSTYYLEARSCEEASGKAENLASKDGVQTDFICVYEF